MFSPEFNQVYDEVFRSGTGLDPTDPDVLAERDTYIAETEAALLEHWTSPDHDTAESIHDLKADRGAMVFRIQHPNTAEFGEEDAHDIARIRYLGHVIIQTATRTAPSYSPTQHGQMRRGISARDWYKAHKIDLTAEREDPAEDPDCPSPLRLETWPNGDYVNCLGASIGVAGQETRDEKQFFYINRLRSANFASSVRTVEIFNKLLEECPDLLFELEPTIRIAGHANIELAKTLKDEFLGMFLKVSDVPIDQAFHHSIITLGGIQVDPFGMVYGELHPYPAAKHLGELLDVTDAGRSNEVILFQSDVANYSFSSAMSVLRDIKKLSMHFRETIGGNKKSDKYFETARNAFAELKEAMWLHTLMYKSDGSNNDIPAETWMNIARKNGLGDNSESNAYWLIYLLNMRAHFYSQEDDIHSDLLVGETINELFDPKGVFHYRETEKVMSAILMLEESMKKDLKYNSKMQAYLNDLGEILPYVLCFDELFRTLRNNPLGSSDQEMEVADPAFMVGAMYMNHYARWRKDGRVNVAKELARITPSQLIWQSAVAQDPDSLSDERVRSVGRLIAGLKHEQLNPLVRITLPIGKVQKDGKEEGADRREGGSGDQQHDRQRAGSQRRRSGEAAA
jgi:hypothetical protein